MADGLFPVSDWKYSFWELSYLCFIELDGCRTPFFIIIFYLQPYPSKRFSFSLYRESGLSPICYGPKPVVGLRLDFCLDLRPRRDPADHHNDKLTNFSLRGPHTWLLNLALSLLVIVPDFGVCHL